ncbi:MAG TPA: hypothetical protein VN920_11245, partial [Pyrinomonadaceae bacterium]|nr:hypothetical protein [Pyrinomonadaceae bacterium]
ADPLSAELRRRQPDDSSRRGFDIGMAVAEGHTAPGPGKQRIGNSLPPAEQRGYNIAVSFSLERNRNADFAAKGAAIAKVDERVAAARTAEEDVFYWLGFDIATGIFGDPALGAKGNTSTGPGSLKIRDSLSPAGQRGFNAAVKFHLGQDAPPSASQPRPRTSDEGTVIGNSGKRDLARDQVYADWKNAGAEPSNEIRCRGYNRRGGSEYVFFTISSRQSRTGETIVTYELAYTPSVKAAGPNGEGLQPGECSFVDRPISESHRIRFETPENAQLKQQLHGTPLDTSPTAAERFPDTQTIPRYLRDQNHYWSFFGVRLEGNSFVATGNRYWKPNP